MSPAVITIVISAFSAFLAVNWIYFKILSIAKKNDLVDNPDARKLQKRPVPVLGGITVFFGLVVGVMVGCSVNFLLTRDIQFSLTPVVCAVVIMIFTGAIDDIMGLSPRMRFAVEILTILGLIFAGGGCIDSFHGLWGIESFSWWIAIPLTVFAGVGIINAVNLIDGVNGLCSGLCILISTVFGAMFIKVSEIPNALLAFSLAAGALPFFFHNVFGRKSRMFLGDAGTMMIGVVMVWFVISILRSDTSMEIVSAQNNSNMIAMSLAILSVPVFDTIRVMTQRIYHRQSPFHPDKTHLHHVFIKAGVSHSVTTAIILAIDAVVVLIWMLSVKLHAGLDTQLYIVIFCGILFVWGMYFFISWNERHHTRFMHWLAKFAIKTHLGHKNWWVRFEQFLDSPEEGYVYEAPEDIAVGSWDSVEERDRKMVMDYLKSKVEVYVDELKDRSGADPGNVAYLVGQGVEDGVINVVKTDSEGRPSIVALKKEE